MHLIVILSIVVSLASLTKADSNNAVCLLPLPPAIPLWLLNTQLQVYTKGKNKSYNIKSLDKVQSAVAELEEAGYFADGRQVVFVTHGYMNSRLFNWLYEIKDNVMKQEDSTVIVVIWEMGAVNLNYQSAAANTKPVAQIVAATASAILDTDTFSGDGSNSYFYCIGHSLGAHICGQAGRSFHKFDRISGIDPAGPGFESCWSSMRLGTDCAHCVDNIHTDGTTKGHLFKRLVPHYGTFQPWGTIDFYPNEGHTQPGCNGISNDATACSHMKSIQYFIHTIKNKGACASTGPCSDPTSLPASCRNSDTQSMGYYSTCHRKSHRVVSGTFSLQASGSGRYC